VIPWTTLTVFSPVLQLTSRKEQEAEVQLAEAQAVEEERAGDREYEEFLRAETERLKLRGFTPRVWLVLNKIMQHCKFYYLRYNKSN